MNFFKLCAISFLIVSVLGNCTSTAQEEVATKLASTIVSCAAAAWSADYFFKLSKKADCSYQETFHTEAEENGDLRRNAWLLE